MDSVLVCIPTITGREVFVRQAIEGYCDRERTPDVEVFVSVVCDRPTAGIGWQECVQRGIAQFGRPDYIHFGNDDVVPARGWLAPLIEAVEHGCAPAPRLEPAGVHLNEEVAESMAPLEAPPRSELSYWYADLPENQPQEDGQQIDHGALPFCSMTQWMYLTPFLPIHFGTDKWFYRQAGLMGWPCVARMDSVIFNYAAQIGRSKGDWTETDFIDFDLNIAYPEYIRGARDAREPHPLRGTPEGLALARSWRRINLPGPHHWEV